MASHSVDPNAYLTDVGIVVSFCFRQAGNEGSHSC